MGISERVRRIFLPILVVLLLAAPVGAEECDHELVYHRVESVCSAQGFEWNECILCGYTCDYKLLPEVPHAFSEWLIVTDPTCTREGEQSRECPQCGEQEWGTIPRLDHHYVDEVIEPTCTARGYTRRTCATCSRYSIYDDVPPLGHDYDVVLISEPTDTTKGRVRFHCLRPQCKVSHQMYYDFRDVPPDGYYFAPVMWAQDRGITSGIDETHFGPEAVCNRAQVVTFLWRAAGLPEPRTAKNPFVDVPAGSFYEKAVLWAYETGVTTGTDATHFSPGASCNRAQVVTFLHRFRGCPEPTEAVSFPDVAVGSFYHKAVQWAAQRGITLGMDGGLFRPELECSRAQIVTFLYRDAKNP